jgi:hypothetical protein
VTIDAVKGVDEDEAVLALEKHDAYVHTTKMN